VPGAQDDVTKPPTDHAGRVLRVTVLCGGPSAERAVSLDSGQAVAEALRRRGHRVFTADVGPDNLGALDEPADVVFPALHGPFGEDGTLQRIMAARGIRFVGADADASALAMDKVAAKTAVSAAGIATPPFELWDQATLARGDSPAILLPVIVKPVDQGSSVATTIVREPAAFRGAVEKSVQAYGRALVERFIVGDELTVGILGTEALPPIVVRPKRLFYDYEAKYHDDATEYLFDAGYPADVLERARSLSLRVFELLGCRHLARVDWMVDREQYLWFLEINTLPGFTNHSLVPKAAQHIGVSFDELVERLVRMAIEETP
jgi:D-alanine-D-alanine ligase